METAADYKALKRAVLKHDIALGPRKIIDWRRRLQGRRKNLQAETFRVTEHY